MPQRTSKVLLQHMDLVCMLQYKMEALLLLASSYRSHSVVISYCLLERSLVSYHAIAEHERIDRPRGRRDPSLAWHPRDLDTVPCSNQRRCTMKVILNGDVPNLGELGDVKDVAA
ncbi:MAG: hypothetical protein EOM15_14025, partial [Spirochaetia bacterium]|nr:hypothetical protein [Spirochaetia bacterium]